MAARSVRTSWLVPPRDDGSERSINVAHAGSDASPMCGLMLASLPLELVRPPQPEDADAATLVPCELTLEWDAQQPLRCQQLQLEVVSSARHVELFIEGVRRSLLGEDEQGEVYLGTFRGTKQSSTTSLNGAAAPQLFTVAHEFLQRDAATNILKETQKLRVKFVSLTGDKSALHLQAFKCAFVRLQEPLLQAPAPAAFAVPQPSALGKADSIAAQLAGLRLGGTGSIGNSATVAPPALAGLDAHAIMQGFQQMLEREMESKILRAVDAKLAVLSQRLAFSEQRLVQLHQQVDANGSDVKASLAHLQQQFAQLESHVKEQLATSGGKTPEPEADTADE